MFTVDLMNSLKSPLLNLCVNDLLDVVHYFFTLYSKCNLLKMSPKIPARSKLSSAFTSYRSKLSSDLCHNRFTADVCFRQLANQKPYTIHLCTKLTNLFQREIYQIMHTSKTFRRISPRNL